jgi:hypothetical protein
MTIPLDVIDEGHGPAVVLVPSSVSGRPAVALARRGARPPLPRPGDQPLRVWDDPRLVGPAPQRLSDQAALVHAALASFDGPVALVWTFLRWGGADARRLRAREPGARARPARTNPVHADAPRGSRRGLLAARRGPAARPRRGGGPRSRSASPTTTSATAPGRQCRRRGRSHSPRRCRPTSTSGTPRPTRSYARRTSPTPRTDPGCSRPDHWAPGPRARRCAVHRAARLDRPPPARRRAHGTLLRPELTTR